MNKKGFTLIELLGTIVIVGLLSSIAIGGTSMYIEKARQQSYDAMQKTLFSAAQNYIIESGILVTSELEISSSDLINNGYIKELEDPKSGGSNQQCTGKVIVRKTKDNPGAKLDEYEYEVKLECSTYTNTKTYHS